MRKGKQEGGEGGGRGEGGEKDKPIVLGKKSHGGNREGRELCKSHQLGQKEGNHHHNNTNKSGEEGRRRRVVSSHLFFCERVGGKKGEIKNCDRNCSVLEELVRHRT